MLSKEDIIKKALELGFQDVGFTTAEPFESQKEILESRKEDYAFLFSKLDLQNGIDPGKLLPDAKSIIVLVSGYFDEAFSRSMEVHFGRCYHDDDRKTKTGRSKRITAFCDFLKEHGIAYTLPGNMPHRLSAARAGLGTFGKNNFFYSNKVSAGSSWVVPLAIVVDQECAPDKPSIEVGCPEWCRNTCIAACPTRAIKGPNRLDPSLCISFLSYYAEEITPPALREPMGGWVFGCDHCQNVCPRNAPALARNLPMNLRAAAKSEDFDLTKLLHMDKEYFETRIRPHMFYITTKNMWLWKMNVARAMGNSVNPDYVPELIRAYAENEDDRVKGMIAWSLGKLGGPAAQSALKTFHPESAGLVKMEIEEALKRF
jgi:epoxyqueuosine reductase